MSKPNASEDLKPTENSKAESMPSKEEINPRPMFMGCYVSTIFCAVNLILFPITIGLVLHFTSSDAIFVGPDTEPLPIHQWQLTQMAFITCLFLDFISWLWTVDKDKSRLFYFVLVINGMPIVTYGLLASGVAPIWASTYGRRVVVLRFLQWVFTTPSMLYLYSIVSSISPRELVIAMVLEYIVIVTGFLASIAASPYDLVFLAICLVCFYFVMATLNKMLTLAIEETSLDDASYRRALQGARAFMTLTWVAIPAVWFAGYLQIVSFLAEETMYQFLDFSTKAGISCMILHSSIKTFSEKQEEIMVKALHEERRRTIEALQEAARIKEKFFTAISHELRTPLNGIIGLADGVMEGSCGEISGKVKSRLETIKMSGQRLCSLVNDILDAASLRNDALRLVEDNVILSDVCGHVVDMTRPLLKRGVQMVFEIGPQVPMIRGDPERIKQILHNLLGNASKFTCRGSVALRVDVDRDRRNVLLAVADTGTGIKPEQLGKIWGAFNQGDEGMARTFGGTGLGLTIAKQLAEAHGGEIVVTSEVGVGTTFTLRLPIQQTSVEPRAAEERAMLEARAAAVAEAEAAADDLDADANAAASHDAGPNAGQGFQSYSEMHRGAIEVLSVDDDPVNQMVIEGLLAPQGYVVTAAMDGDEALDILKNRGYLPDIVLLDCQMPGKHGFEVCAELRSLYPESLPIIMVSANTDEDNILQGFRSGSNDYVKKPFSRAEVLARIRTQLKLRDMWLKEVQENKEKSSILQMIPHSILERLQAGSGTALVMDEHKLVSVLTCEFSSLSDLAGSCSKADLVLVVNDLLAAFDNLAIKHDVYKVENLVEGYMVISGHDSGSARDHHQRVFNMAMDMLATAQRAKLPGGQEGLSIRIGMHCGPAFAAVIGFKKPSYTFFGHTINVSSRLESKGYPQCIHVSAAMREALGNVTDWLDYSEHYTKDQGIVVTYLARAGDWEAALAARAAAAAAAGAAGVEPVDLAMFGGGGATRSGNMRRAYQKVLDASVTARGDVAIGSMLHMAHPHSAAEHHPGGAAAGPVQGPGDGPGGAEGAGGGAGGGGGGGGGFGGGGAGGLGGRGGRRRTWRGGRRWRRGGRRSWWSGSTR